MKELSQLLNGIPGSITVSVNEKAKAMQAAGLDIISLAGGDPDFDTPKHIVEAAVSAIRAGKTHYPAPSKGTPGVLEAIARKMARENRIAVDSKRDVIVTPGSKWALFIALAAVVNMGDEVLYLEPAWVSYPPMIRLVGGRPVAVSLPAENNFTISEKLLSKAISHKTKAILINSPNNPTGRVLTREEVEAVTSTALKYDLFVIADEVYEKLIYDDRPHYSIGAEAKMAERTITTNGLSKAYAMTGWRLGWLVGPTEIINLAAKYNSHSITSAATFTMSAAVAALDGPQDAIEEMRGAYQDRRDFMLSAISSINGIECHSPEGAFYLYPRFTQTKMDSLNISESLLEHAGIAATPGIAFGAGGEKHLRFSFATAMSELEDAAERLARVVPRL